MVQSVSRLPRLPSRSGFPPEQFPRKGETIPLHGPLEKRQSRLLLGNWGSFRSPFGPLPPARRPFGRWLRRPVDRSPASQPEENSLPRPAARAALASAATRLRVRRVVGELVRAVS